MQASTGDRLVIHGKQVGQTDRHGEILEVRGENGGPPYLVKFDDETLLYPGADCELEREHQAR